MSDRRRALPTWMEKKEEVKEKQPLLSRRRRKVARAAFYCMNEKELVEAAVSYLTNAACEDVALLTDQKAGYKAAETTLKIREKPASSKPKEKSMIDALEEESSDCSHAQEMMYISETDCDITDVEVVPCTKSQKDQEPKGQGSGPAQDHMNVELEADKRVELSQIPADVAEEDDDFRLVREIFFT